MKTGQNKNARRVARTPDLQNAKSRDFFSLLLSQLSYPGDESNTLQCRYMYGRPEKDGTALARSCADLLCSDEPDALSRWWLT